MGIKKTNPRRKNIQTNKNKSNNLGRNQNRNNNLRRNKNQHGNNNSRRSNNPNRTYTRNDNYDQTEEEELSEDSDEEQTREEENKGGKFKVQNYQDNILKIKIALIAALVILVVGLLLIIVIFIASLFGGASAITSTAIANASTIQTVEQYHIDCTEVTVESNNGSQSGTYSLEDYVAGVVNAEVGMMNNTEIFKAFAIAARTYFLYNNNNCSIENSSSTQNFVEVSDSTEIGRSIIQAVNDTKGQVILDEDSNLINTQYDAFCTIAVDDDYYTLKQRNQKIPRSWADNQSGIKEDWKKGQEIECHGNGASQWGAYYLAYHENAPYSLILNYYYADNDNQIFLSSPILTTSIDGLDIKNTTGASKTLNKPIDNFLRDNGSSLADYNSYIKQNVTSAGIGTRAGVVTAAASMINYLYDNFDTKLPYYWGGYSLDIGIPASFGSTIPSNPSPSGRIYQFKSFDCSGFVSWAIRNGGYKFSRLTTSSFESKYGQYGCNITETSCIGQPGDLINSVGHVKMIVSVDEANNRYFVAESTTNGVIIQTHGMHTPMSNGTKILHMDNFYNDASNVDSNY